MSRGSAAAFARVEPDGPNWNRHAVVTFDGQLDTHIKTGEDYGLLSLGALFEMRATDRDKRASPACIPSSYCSYDAREHARQREAGQFVALCGDVDAGDHSMDRICDLVTTWASDAAWLVYSSAHARDGDMRWRIVLPLDETLSFVDWHDAQCAFFDFMEGAGVAMDRALARAAQPVYLPNVPQVHAKSGTLLRAPDGTPLFFRSRSTGTDAPGIRITAGAAADGIADIRQKRAADDLERDRIRREAQNRRAARPSGDSGSIIADFNASNSVASILALCGYEQSPRNPEDWRSPNQNGDTYATRVIDEKWVSLSSSDAACGVGEGCSSGCFGDAYDLFVHYKHGDDHKSAFRQLHRERVDSSIGSSAGRRTIAIAGAQEPSVEAAMEVDEPPVWMDEAQAAFYATMDSDPGEDPAVPTMRTARAATVEPDSGVNLTDFYAYMPMGKFMFAPSRELWPAFSVNSRVPAQKALDKRGNPIVRDGEVVSVSASQWLAKERAVEQMTWAPGEPMIVPDRLVSDGGWIARPGCSCFNLYRPPIVDPGDAGRAERWVNHVFRVYPNDANHIITWLAQRVQRPQDKINHALVLGGNQGIGKDTMLEPAKYAVGAWNCAEVSPKHITGRFNGFLKAVILRVSEARDLGDLNRYDFYEHLKTYTAAPPDVLRVDEKNMREHSIFNIVGLIITTNHKTDGIYLPADDRRHYVAWSDLKKEEFTDAYWKSLWEWYEAGGLAHVAEYLRTLDIRAFNPKAPPPKTAAWHDIVNSNRAPEDAELADALDGIGWPAATTLSSISGSTTCSPEFAGFLRDRKSSRLIPHRLDAVGYVAVRNEGAKDNLWKVFGKRQVIYAKADMPPRDRIAAATALAR